MNDLEFENGVIWKHLWVMEFQHMWLSQFIMV